VKGISVFKRASKVAAAIGLAGALLVAYVPQAQAAPSTILNEVGSEAAYGVMQGGTGTQTGLTTLFNNSQSTIQAVDTPAKLGSPFPPSPFAVPGDSNCAAFNNDNSDADHTPPNGGSAGVTRLNQNTGLGGGTGCVDIARNSRPRSGEPATDEMYEYALDSVSVAAFPTQNTGVPTTLSVQDVKDIFSCDATGQAPKVTNWDDLTVAHNTDANAIHRYLPPAGAATRNFFLQQYLGVPSANTSSFVGLGCTTSPNANPLNITLGEQNIGTAVPNADRQFAVLIYSQGNWSAQNDGVDPAGDVRNGVVLDSICPAAALKKCKKPTALNEVTAKAFFGQRPITNVIRSDGPSHAAALSFVGVSASGNGFICSTDAKTHKAVSKLIKKFGYKALKKAPAGTGLPASYCRVI
jgi:hypothetical protein